MLQTKILLIDDEEAFVQAMEKRLSKRRLNVCCASSGGEGLKKLSEDPDVDVVILDVKMPVMDGIETLREIKKRFPTMEVIMLTGHGAFESAIQGMRLGAFDYLMKPCDLEELVAKVEEAKMKRRRRLDRIVEAASRNDARSRIPKPESDTHQKA